MTPFFALTREVAALDLALRQASDELNRSKSRRRRQARTPRSSSDRRW